MMMESRWMSLWKMDNGEEIKVKSKSNTRKNKNIQIISLAVDPRAVIVDPPRSQMTVDQKSDILQEKVSEGVAAGIAD